MFGNPINFDKKYSGNSPIWGKSKLDANLKRYLNLLGGKNVLDLGIGEGKNSIFLSELGYNVTGVDFSAKSLGICKSRNSDIELIQSDIRTYDIEADKYDLIMSDSVLHFLHKDDAFALIDRMKFSLKKNGLIFISVFSTEEPGLNEKLSNSSFECLDNCIFHNVAMDTYVSYFSKDEIKNLFSDFSTVMISDEFFMDLSHGSPHYHGVIKYIGRKIN